MHQYLEIKVNVLFPYWITYWNSWKLMELRFMASQRSFWSMPHMAFKSVSFLHCALSSYKLKACSSKFLPIHEALCRSQGQTYTWLCSQWSPYEVWLKMKVVPVMSSWILESLRHNVHNLGRGYKLTLSNAWSLSNFNNFSVTWRIRLCKPLSMN